MIKKLGMPYMGSKCKLSSEIVEYILNNNPNCKYLYDLFGGGSISFTAIQYPQIKKVFYNELNTGVVELLKKINEDGITDDIYQWIDRDTFRKHKNSNDWFGGLCKVIWSFGNNQINYLYGKNEEIKKELHDYLFKNGYDKTSKMRTNIIKQFNDEKKIIGLLRLEHIERIERISQITLLNKQHLSMLELTNLSYEKLLLTTPIDETIIYLDPPYLTKESILRFKNESNYYNGFNYHDLLAWIKSSPYKIYLSSYEFSGLYEVFSMEHRSIITQTKNNSVQEKLFCNRKENQPTNKCLFDLF